MSVVAVLIGFSLLVAGGFLIAFLWAVKSGQYDDKYTPSVRILFEDEKQQNNSDDNSINKEKS
ncbi:MAG: cbb3-type cytochrome oxidase assembly protein CcoS [Ignavibacteriales bacterium]|nr:cbb3-type cytochrome oxidase assembly protein CcoS [Ignavibacteriales bacterium]MBI5727128.1 cbb3-type cytochrome oxidase assembly protein CcoS [Ignavibacteriales bacterium]